MSFRVILSSLAVATLVSSAIAAETPKQPERQTSWGLYVDSKEAYQMKTGPDGKGMLLVDVRDPIEIQFTGFTDVADLNIPYITINRQKWNEKRNIYELEVNQDFEALIAKALAERNLSKESPIILMCRSGGERGAPSAKMLDGKGYAKVYVVVDGFEGDTVKEGEKKHWRLVNGWKNSGLPWSYSLNKGKMFMPQ